MPRFRFLAATAIIGASTLSPPVHAQSVGRINFIGEQSFAANSRTFGGTTIGGLSGLDYDQVTGTYLSNSDNTDTPNAPRFYTLTADITRTTFNGVTFTGLTQVSPVGGNIDFENIRLSQDRQSVYITSEGNANAGVGPSVYQFDRNTGAQLSRTSTPSQFVPSGGIHGIRFNLGFESQTFTDSTFSQYLVSNEGPVIQDVNIDGLPPNTTNPAAVFNVPQPLRMVKYDTATGNALAQYVYIADPLANPVPVTGTTFGVQGITDMIAYGQDSYIAMERSFTVGGSAGGGTGYDIKLYQFSLSGATDVSGFDSLHGQSFTPIHKRLLLDLATLPITLDNVEGMTLGPDLGNGERALLLVSDDNFTTGQKTQFLAFTVAAAPEPGTLALLGVGFLPLAGILVRRRN